LKREEFRAWLQKQEYTGNVVNTGAATLSRIESQMRPLGGVHDDLDAAYDSDRLEQLRSLITDLQADAKQSGQRFRILMPDTTDPVKRLHGFGFWLRQYRRFRDDQAGFGMSSDWPEFQADDDGAPKTSIMPEPTNLILYGPPGTGKTYATAEEAVRLCDGAVPGTREGTFARYRQLVEAGQIAFVTFHQSYAYEDFIEGLRPVIGGGDETPTGGFQLEPRKGIFREICALAEQARKSGASAHYEIGGRRIFKMSLGRAGLEEHIYDAAIEGGYIALGWGGQVDWSDPKFEDYRAVFDRWNQDHPGTSGNSGNIAQTWCFRQMKEGDLVVVSDGNFRFRAIGEVTGQYQFDPTGAHGYPHWRAVKWLAVFDESLPVDTIYTKPFSQQSCYSLADSHIKHEGLARLLPGKAQGTDTPDQFVIVIDEINRANLSKVFGELITLIEPDKRLGMPSELKVKLPYSGDTFGVPANLHIIGTMNTADRSIALLDTALRRRFVFRELMPEPVRLTEASAQCGVDLVAFLAAINTRIEYLFDREHQIGHAYFMHCRTREDVDAAMRHRIIPLLAEYFFEDWRKIALVLGDADGKGRFLEQVALKAPPGFDDGDPDERTRWLVKSVFSEDAYHIAA
jgi:5-methylcytosine-specific restriction protein B